MMWLSDQVFKTVIQSAPLISIDFIIRNEKNEILLGKRINAPAKGFWFVLGGRVQKDETLDDAFIRLLNEELGIVAPILRSNANFLGVYEHFYKENVFDQSASTHYVVMCYEFSFKELQQKDLPKCQHRDYIWISEKNILSENHVHEYCKNYFK